MIRAAVIAATALAAGGAAAQTAAATATAPGGALLRGLDRMAGASSDILLTPGQDADFGHIRILLHECRFPAGEPLADAFARLTVTDAAGAALFSGWMVASSPALSAFDHPRYDLWVLRCNTPAAEAGNG
jgi:hypothetical protein